MIIIRITGPLKAIKIASERITTMYQSGGTIVRHYEVDDVPDKLPTDAGVIIITQAMEVPNGKETR